MWILILLFSTSVNAMPFGIKFLNLMVGVKNFGLYRSYIDGTFGKNCSSYRVGSGKYGYFGDIGSYSYRINPASGSPIDVYCDMSTPTGWTDITSGLVLNFSFDTINATDSVSGLNPTVTFAGATQTYTGKRSNGIKPIKIVSGSIAVAGTSQMTACAWMNIPTTSAMGAKSYYGFGRYTGQAANSGRTWYRLAPYGFFTGVAQQTYGPVTNDIMLYDGQFHHYCTSVDTASQISKTYRDGNLIYAFIMTRNYWNAYGGNLSLLEELQTADLMSVTDTPIMDEWKLYNRVLSSTEVRGLSQSTFQNSLITNGEFLNGITGWTGSYGSYDSMSGSAVISVGLTSANYFRQTIATNIGQLYTVTFTVWQVTGTAGSAFNSYAMPSGNDPRNGATIGVSGLITAPGTYSYTFTATSSATQIVLSTEVQNNGLSYISNIGVQ